MITVDTRLLILNIFISYLFYFLAFNSVYDMKLIPLYKKILFLPTFYFAAIFIAVFVSDIVYLVLLVIIYFSLRNKNSNKYYLVNSILLALLFEFTSSTIASAILTKIYLVYKLNNLLLITGMLLIQLIILLIIIFIFKKLKLNSIIQNFSSPSLSIVLTYSSMVILAFMYFIQKFKAYLDLTTGILIFLIVQGIAIAFIFIHENVRQKEVYEKKLMSEQLDNLSDYTKQLDSDQKEMHKFRHDYKNILNSLNEIATVNDNNDLKSSLKELEGYSTTYFSNISMDDFKDLEYISNPYIKSLMISKLKTIKSNNIDCYFECKSDIDNVSINIFDLIRLMGASIDNAIEAVKEQPSGKIQIILINTDGQLEISIKNTIVKHISVSKIEQYGFSSKKNHDGLGMINIQDIKKKYKNLLVSYNTRNNWFSMQFTITKSGGKK